MVSNWSMIGRVLTCILAIRASVGTCSSGGFPDYRMSLNQRMLQIRAIKTTTIAPVTTRCWYILQVKSICEPPIQRKR